MCKNKSSSSPHNQNKLNPRYITTVPQHNKRMFSIEIYGIQEWKLFKWLLYTKINETSRWFVFIQKSSRSVCCDFISRFILTNFTQNKKKVIMPTTTDKEKEKTTIFWSIAENDDGSECWNTKSVMKWDNTLRFHRDEQWNCHCRLFFTAKIP